MKYFTVDYKGNLKEVGKKDYLRNCSKITCDFI